MFNVDLTNLIIPCNFVLVKIWYQRKISSSNYVVWFQIFTIISGYFLSSTWNYSCWCNYPMPITDIVSQKCFFVCWVQLFASCSTNWTGSYIICLYLLPLMPTSFLCRKKNIGVFLGVEINSSISRQRLGLLQTIIIYLPRSDIK
jgi:hypothetical protein